MAKASAAASYARGSAEGGNGGGARGGGREAVVALAVTLRRGAVGGPLWVGAW